MSVLLIGMVSILSLMAAGATASAQTMSNTRPSVHFVARSTPITHTVIGATYHLGQVSARLVPLSQSANSKTSAAQSLTVTPDTSSSCEDQVCIYLFGSGLTVKPWIMTATPLLPGDCTFGVFWVPENTQYLYGPDLCNDTNGPAAYQSELSYIKVSGPVRVCNTAIGFSGKACENIERSQESLSWNAHGCTVLTAL